MRSLRLRAAALGLCLFAACGEETGLLDLTLNADPQAPPAQGATVELAGSGGILRSHAGKFPPDGASSLRLQYPGLPTKVITFRVRTLDASGCVVGESPAPFQVEIRAGAKATAMTTVRRSSGSCGDGGGITGIDGGPGSDVGQPAVDTATPIVDAGFDRGVVPDATVDVPAVPDAPALDLPAMDLPAMDLPGMDTLVALEAGVGAADTPLPPGPIIISFIASPSTISAGSSTTLTAVFLNATASSVDHGIGSLTSGNGVTTGPLTTTTTYKLTVTDAAGNTVSQTVTVTVVPLPSISSLTAQMPTIATGTLTQLTAVFTGGHGTIDNRIGAVESGIPIPTGMLVANTTFTLTVTNAAGDSASKATTVAVSTTVGPGTFTATGSPVMPRREHTATLLANGKVLVVGGGHAAAELYDPASGTFMLTGALSKDRSRHTATLLRDGKVLVTGGYPPDRSPAYSPPALYDPATGTFADTGDMVERRADHTATLLLDGRVLIAGGESSGYLATAELYDPTKRTFTQTGPMSHPRMFFTANLLLDGQVLAAGGYNVSDTPPRGYAATADIWDPATDRWSPTGSMFYARCVHTSVTLVDGRVLLAGGVGSGDSVLAAEIYDPQQRSFSRSGDLQISRYAPSSALLPNGNALVVGTKFPGTDADSFTSEIYNPALSASGRFSPGPTMTMAHGTPTATLLPSGAVLVVDGTGELYW